MSTRREYYKFRAEALNVPSEVEPIPLVALLEKEAESNIYARCVDISRYAERILAELMQELRERLQELDMREDMRLDLSRISSGVESARAGAEALWQEEIRREAEQYRALPKPSLIAMWEAIYGEYERLKRQEEASAS